MSTTSSRLRLVQTGFWLGLGLLISLVCAHLAGSAIDLAIFNATVKGKIEDSVKLAASGVKQTEHVQVTAFTESADENYAVFRGAAQNTGTDAIASFAINVEFFDDQKKFLTECTERVVARVKPNTSENFEIRCRMNSQDPKHSLTTVRVVSTSIF